MATLPQRLEHDTATTYSELLLLYILYSALTIDTLRGFYFVVQADHADLRIAA
jgi:hypothetical protein